MGFKLGREKGLDVSSGEIKTKMRFSESSMSIPGTPIIRKDLGEGIMGEANMDGSIFLSKSIEPDSRTESEALIHEMRHATDMKIGKLRYEDYHVDYNGNRYERQDRDGMDMISFEGKWIQAGSSKLPWENEANNGQ